MHSRRDIGVCERESVTSMHGSWLRRESCLVQHTIEKMARTVSRKRPPSAIGSVCPWRQAQDQHAAIRIAPTRNRLGPIFKIAICAALLNTYLLAVRNQARTARARNNFLIQLFQLGDHLGISLAAGVCF